MNEERFTGKSDVYTKFRPAYAPEFIDYLYDEVGFNAYSVIADIAAGTGILSKQLLDRGSTVFCVEPNADMAEKSKIYLADYEKCRFFDATAESTLLESDSVNYITVAQAFHWFERDKFRAECQRILKGRGKVILVWNCRGEGDLVQENDSVNRKYCCGYKGWTGGSRIVKSKEYANFFTDGSCEYKEFKNDLKYNLSEFIGRNLSSSYAPKENDEFYHAYITDLERIFVKYSIDGIAIMPNFTVSYSGSLK